MGNKIMNDYDEEQINLMINDCIERESKLTDWERGFVSTCENMAGKNIMLSKPQRDKLNEIWNRIT